MSEVTYFILYILQHNKGRHQPFWSDPLNPIFCLSLIFLAGTLRSLPVQVRLLLVLAAAPHNSQLVSIQEREEHETYTPSQVSPKFAEAPCVPPMLKC